MSQENVKIMRRAFEAYNRGDLGAVVADFAPECEYVLTGTMPDRPDLVRGPEGYLQVVSWVREEFDEARVEIDETIGTADKVVISLTASGVGTQSRADVKWHFWQVWQIDEGKVVRGQGFPSKAEALEAVGLSE